MRRKTSISVRAVSAAVAVIIASAAGTDRF